MVRTCREQGAPFGVVTLLTGDEVHKAHTPPVTYHHVGTLATIDSVSPLNSGLELIECTGRERFRIMHTRKLQKSDLWVADVELLPADSLVPIPEHLHHARVALSQVLSQLSLKHLTSPTEAQLADCGWVANRWCELFPMTASMQLQLLELDNPLLRLELVTDALETAGIARQN